MENTGYKNEFDIIESVNNKRFSQLNEFMKTCIAFMFPNVTAEDIIQAEKYLPHAKADIKFIVNGLEKYVSVKSSRSKYLHAEGIDTFTSFLKDLEVSEETINTIRYFQYGDDTLNGTGKIRKSHDEIMAEMKNEIAKANYELSKAIIIEKTLERFIFTGGYDITHRVDYILYGDYKYGIIVSHDELMKYVLRRNTYYLRTLHIGPIVLRPYLRDINFVSMYQEKRNVIQGDWGNLWQDMLTIAEHR